MRRAAIALLVTVVLAGCGSSSPPAITIGAARTFQLARWSPAVVRAGAPTELSFRIDQPSGAALTRYPNADGLYIWGGSWLSEPVCQALEKEFGKPAISNPSAMVWDTLTRLGAWAPIPGQGKLLSSA